MKADWCGTLTEQARHKMGWIKATERVKKGIQNSCGNCCASLNSKQGIRCERGNFATRISCVCKEHAVVITKEKS